MRILISGNMGYVGSVVTRHLRSCFPEAKIIGFDSGFFAHYLTDAPFLPEIVLDQQIYGDIRDLPPELLQGITVVVHLAAISNDAMGKRFDSVTEAINQRASLRIAALARDAGVKSFVFASSCSIYGAADTGTARKEGDTLNPLTAYARSKIATEEGLRGMASGSGMVISCLRFATACGMSDRLRLDLVVNDFVAGALACGEITVLSDGTPWRPLIDVCDMGRAIEWAVTRQSTNGGDYLAVNIGANNWNYQVCEIAHTVAKQVPGTRVSINSAAPADNRSYKVDFGLFRSLAPAHQPLVTLADSIISLHVGLQSMDFTDRNFRKSKYMRLCALETDIAANHLTEDLRWRNDVPHRKERAV